MNRTIAGTVLLTCLIATVAVADPCPSEIEEALLGPWDWVRAVNNMGDIRGPEDWGYTQQFVFLPDHTLIEYRDGVERVRTTWSLHCDALTGDTFLIIPPTVPEIFMISFATLVLTFGEEGGHPKLEIQESYGFPDSWRYDFVMSGSVPTELSTWGALKSLYR